MAKFYETTASIKKSQKKKNNDEETVKKQSPSVSNKKATQPVKKPNKQPVTRKQATEYNNNLKQSRIKETPLPAKKAARTTAAQRQKSGMQTSADIQAAKKARKDLGTSVKNKAKSTLDTVDNASRRFMDKSAEVEKRGYLNTIKDYGATHRDVNANLKQDRIKAAADERNRKAKERLERLDNKGTDNNYLKQRQLQSSDENNRKAADDFRKEISSAVHDYGADISKDDDRKARQLQKSGIQTRNKALGIKESATSDTIEGTLKQTLGSHLKAIGDDSNEYDEYKSLLDHKVNMGELTQAEADKKMESWLRSSNRFDRYVDWENSAQHKAFQKISEKGKEIYDSGTKQVNDAAEGASGLKKAYLGALGSGVGMTTDMALGPAWFASMASRTYGASIGEAEKEGADRWEDRRNAGAQALKEVGTEFLFQGIGIAGGLRAGSKLKGLSPSDWLEHNAFGGMLAGSNAGGTMMRLASGTLEENAEEAIAWGLDPLISNSMYKNSLQIRNERSAREGFQSESEQLRSYVTDPETASAMAAYLGSDEYLSNVAKAYVDSGAPEDIAKKMAILMRDYLTASLTGDTDGMEALEDEMVKLAAGDVRETWSWDELKDTLASTTLLTMTTGLPGSISTTAMGNEYVKKNGIGAVTGLADQVLKYDKENSAKAKAIKDRIEAGKNVSGSQVAELISIAAEAADSVEARKAVSDKVKARQMKREDLRVEPLEQTSKGPVMNEKTAEAYQERFDATMELLDAINESTYKSEANDAEDRKIAHIVASFETGVIDSNQINELTIDNPEIRAVFEMATGINLNQYNIKDRKGNLDTAGSNVNMQEKLFALAADNYIKMARAEQAQWENATRGQVHDAVTKGFGKKASQAMHDVLKSVDPRDQSKYILAARTAQTVYDYAMRTDLGWDKVNALVKKLSPDLDMDAVRRVYDAARLDKAEADTLYLGRTTAIGQAMRFEKSDNGVARITGEFHNEGDRVLDGDEDEALRTLADNLGINIRIVPAEQLQKAPEEGKDSVTEGEIEATFNGSYNPDTGEILLADTNALDDNIRYAVSHEVTHHLAMYAPDAYKALKNYVMNAWYKGNKADYDAAIKERQVLYKLAAKQDLSEEAALEEIIADATRDFWNDPKFIEKLAQTEEPGFFKSILNAIRETLRKLRNMLATGRFDGTPHEDVLWDLIGTYSEAEKLWLKAYREAIKNKAAVGRVDWDAQAEAESSYSITRIIGPSGKDYGIGVKLDSTEYDDLDDSEKKKKMRELANDLAGDTFIAKDRTGSYVEITVAPKRKFRNKLGKRVYANKDLGNKNNNKEIKRETVALADELIVASEFQRDSAPNYSHDWIDNYGKGNWEYWDVIVQDKNGAVWNATLNVANSDTGEKILYDIDPIKKVEGAIKLATPSTKHSITASGAAVNTNGLTISNGNARWTDERIDRLIREFGASNQDYSQAYAVLMNPRDYLKLTLSDDMLDKWNAGSNDPAHPETYSLDEEELRRNEQTPFLKIFSSDGTEIFGHEGRHRMRALMEAGIKSVPVVLQDPDTKYSKVHTDSMTLTAQDFGYDPVNNNAHITVTDLVPIKESNRDELIQKFGGEAQVRFSLTPVRPVEPSTNAWKSGANFAEVKAAHPTLFEQDTDQAEQSKENDKRHLTQVKNTVSTYNKIYDMLGPDFKGTILDASSGLGEGTRSGRENYGFDVDDIEPYPAEDYKPRYMDYSTLDKQYDVVISNAVLNVLTQDDRDAMVNHIGELLKPGGRAFINVRGSDVLNAKNKIAIDESNMEYFIPKTSKSGYYQKGFTPKELKAYLEDALGPGFTVTNSTKFGKSAAIVTKAAGSKLSITPKMDADYMAAVKRGDMETAQRMVDEAAREAGFTLRVYHGSRSEEPFTKFIRPADNDARYDWGAGFVYVTPDEGYAEEYAAPPEWSDPDGIMMEGFINPDDFIDIGGVDDDAFDTDEHFKIPTDFNDKEAINRQATADLKGVAAAFNMTPFELLHELGERLFNDIHWNPYTYDIVNRPEFAEFIKSRGYKGIKLKEFFSDAYGLPDINQFKSADPVTYADDGSIIPLSERFDPNNDDIRYSISTTDSTGRVLSDGQMEYFKNSQARDRQGRLVPVYHTTNHGGFTIFDPSYSDDFISLFFSDSFEVSQTYGKHPDSPRFGPDSFAAADENKAAIERMKEDSQAIVKRIKITAVGNTTINGESSGTAFDIYVVGASRDESGHWHDIKEKRTVRLDPELIEEAESIEDIDFAMEDLKAEAMSVVSEMLGVDYEYVSEIDDATIGWGLDIDYTPEYGIDAVDTDGARAALEDYGYNPEAYKQGYYSVYLNLVNPLVIDGRRNNWNDLSNPALGIVDREWEMYTDETTGKQMLSYTDNGGEPVDVSYNDAKNMLGATLLDKIETRWFENDYGSIRTKWDTINDALGYRSKTRDIAEYAYANGYDGVIIRNIADVNKRTANPFSDIYIAFNANQVKDTENLNPTTDPDFRYSLSSSLEAIGCTMRKENGYIIAEDQNGNRIEEFTEDFIMKSPLGRVLKTASSSAFGTLTKADVKAQVGFLTKLYNMILKTQDPDLIWAVSGTLGYNPHRKIDESTPQEWIQEQKSKFASITGNADPQYKTTIDFTTICVKTQAIIDAMSALMMDMGRGLSEHEIIDIVYNETAMAGEQVPCPVCYVFSRWVGLGKLFGNIKQYQKEFRDKDIDAIRAERDKIQKEVDKIVEKQTGKKSDSKARTKIYKETIVRLNELELPGRELTKAEEKEYEKIKERLLILDRWSWLEKTRLADDYKEVPDDVLFDINAGRKFATEYPATWRFRTTRGPSLGKAAAPYSPSRLGDTIRGIATPSSIREVGESDRVFLEEDNKKADELFYKAYMNALRQNRMNGQRLQSTSDFRFEYGLDYLLSFIELGAIGAKAQMYTKVPEAVKFLASTGAEVNCSIMPKGTGVVWNEKDQKWDLEFSDVTGMAWEDARALAAAYDNVQPILVAIGRQHLISAMAHPEVTMIIPYHASGSSKKRYLSMMRTVGESVEERTDFAKYENEHIYAKSGRPALCRDIRTKLLMGEYLDKDGNFVDLTEEERDALANNKVLRQLFIRVYGKDENGNNAKPDPKYVENFDKDGNDKDCYHVFLNMDQAGVMMPYEYWDKTSTIETADEQGKAYVAYCKSLGLRPVFSGYSTGRKYDKSMDFTGYPGYWKVLIDRCMYNRDGSYHKQQAVNVKNADLDLLDSEKMRDGIFKPLKVNDPAKTEEIVRKSRARIEAEEAEKEAKEKAKAARKKLSVSPVREKRIPEEQVLDYVRENAEDLSDIPLRDPLLEDNRIKYSASMKGFEDKIQSDWDEHYRTYGKLLDDTSVSQNLINMMKHIMSESETGRVYKADTLKATINDMKVMYYMMKSGRPEEFADKAWKAAERIVDDIDYNDDLYVEYKRMRDYLSRRRIQIPEGLDTDEDMVELVRDNRGRMRLESEGNSVEAVYKYLRKNYPELFVDGMEDPIDMLLQIDYVLDLTDPYRDAYTSEEHADLVENVAATLCDMVRQGEAYRSVADDLYDRFNAQTKAMKQRHREALRKVRTRRDERIQEEKDKTARQKQRAENWKRKHREYMQKVKQERQDRAERKEHRKHFTHILDNYNMLCKWVLDPTKDKNVPEEFRSSLAKFLQTLDLQTENSKKLEAKTGRTSMKTFRMYELNARLAELAAMKGEDGVSLFEIDANVAYLVESLTKKLDGKPVDALDADDINAVDVILKAIIRNIQRYKEVKLENKMAEISDIGDRAADFFVDRIRRKGQAKDYKGARGALHTINETALTPAYFFDRMGPLKEMYDVLRHNGFDTYIRNEAMIISRLKGILSKYYRSNLGSKKKPRPGSTIEEWRDDRSAQTIELTNGPITMSVAQMMSLYCLSHRLQALGHMTVGGIMVTPIQTGSKIESAKERYTGKKSNKQKIVLNDADIQTIIDRLTPEQKEVANQLQQLMAVDMAKLGNEAHRELYGYEIFNDPDYFPIKVHGNEIATDINNIGQVVEKIKSYGPAKPLVPHANNVIEVDDIFSVVADHCNGMNLYNAYLVPITDFMKVLNYTRHYDNGDSITMKDAIEQAYGPDALKYIMNLMKDINGIKADNRGGLEGIMNSVLGKAKRAAVFGNVRVALQQPTAVVRALAVMDHKYLMPFIGIKPEIGAKAEMYKYCPIAQWKSWGYYDTYMGRDIEDVMMNTWSRTDVALSGIYGELDNWTWSLIWRGVKAEMADAHPEMDTKSEEFLQLCGRRASEVFDKTQVVDSTFHRSDAMRNKQVAVKVFTAFMAEPTLTLNVFRAGLYNAGVALREGDKAKAAKIAGKAVEAVVLQAIIVSAAQAVADAWRGKDPGFPWDDDDDDEAAEQSLNWWQDYLLRWQHNFIYNLFDQAHLENNLYLVKDVTPYINYMISQAAEHFDWNPTLRAFMGWDQDYLYSQNNLIFSGIENTATGVSQTFKKLEKGEEYDKGWYDIVQKTLSGIGTVTGIPFGTLMRDFKPVINKVFSSAFALDSLEDLDPKISQVLHHDKVDREAAKQETEAETTTATSGTYDTGDLPDSLTDEQKAEIQKAGQRRVDKGVKSVDTANRDRQTMLFEAAKAAAGYEGEARNKKIWESVSEGYKAHVEAGDFAYVAKMRQVVEEVGGDLEYFDSQVLKTAKTAMKKTIEPGGADTESEMMAQQSIKRYLLSHGLSEKELSQMVYESASAKDLKIAFRINDEMAVTSTASALTFAGLSEDDFYRLYENRNRIDLKKYDGKYKDRLKSTGTFVWPAQGTITSHFGYRNAPTRGASSNHPAIDIGAASGSSVVASDGGVIITAGWNNGYGYSVGIKHDNGMVTYYNHLYSWNVKVGDTVAQGQQIAQVGSTGISTGPHLDFKILDTNGKPVDPEKYLPTN